MWSITIRGGLAAAGLAIVVLSFGFAPQLHAQQAAVVDPRLAAKGAWDSGTTYAKDDIVTARGSAWISLRANNLNKVPGQTQPSTAAYWRLFARGFNPAGAWLNTNKYQPDDLVTQNGQTYRAKITNQNRTPNHVTYWELFAAKGAPGPNTGVSAGSQSAPAISFSGDADTGIFSPATGKIALVEDGTVVLHNKGTANAALGASALQANSSGASNTAVGVSTLAVATTASFNTAVGHFALTNGTGDENTAVGYSALKGFGTSNGNYNTVVGSHAMEVNGTGSQNTALGQTALFSNMSGSQNTGVGVGALGAIATSSQNTAVGHASMSNMTSGGFNVALGYATLVALPSGNNNIAIGANAGLNVDTAANNAIFIGNQGLSGDTTTIKIGTQGTQTTAFVAGIRGKTTGVADAVAVLIDSAGQLGTVSSSRRYKYDIESMADVSAMLAKVRPVTFRYKQAQNDGAHPLQYGLIAEEVAEVFPDLAVFKEGQPETVKYHLLPAFLLAGWQAQQKTIAAQAAKIDAQEEKTAAQARDIELLKDRLARIEAAMPPVTRAALR